jgi:site-specific DNA recombinase
MEVDPVWDELFPAEQARIVQLLVERIDEGEEGGSRSSWLKGKVRRSSDRHGPTTRS